MSLPAQQKLRQKASLALRSGDFEQAIALYRQLEALMPKDPTWPERSAAAWHELGRSQDELACLLRALELQIDVGQVLPAIATCRQILDIDSEHPSTLDCLHLLYSESTAKPAGRVVDHAATGAGRAAAAHAADAPLVELELTEVIAGARSLQMGDGEPDAVSEIPLEESHDGERTSEPIALRLELRRPEQPARARGTRRRKAAPQIPSEPARSIAAREELARTPLFGSLDAATLRDLMSKVRLVRLETGDVLFREGDPASTLYVVVDGAVVPIAEGPPRTRLAVLENGAFFGEIGLVTNQPRNATIEALVPTRLLAIDRKVMWSLIRGHSEMSKVLLRFLRERLIDRQLSTHPFFAAFARAERAAIAKQFRFLEVKPGTCVVEQGRPCEGLFVLLAGEMDVMDAARDKLEGSLGSGDLFGGVPPLLRGPARASVIARGKCWVLVLGEGPFRRILDANPGLEKALASLPRAEAGAEGAT